MGTKKTSHEHIEPEARRGHHYREYKILLRADRFETAEGFTRYRSLARDVAAEVGVHVDPGSGGHEVRAVSFFDTPDFDLYRAGFILRRRRDVVDDFPVEAIEHTLKFRHPDLATVSAVEMTTSAAESTRHKLKQEILPAPGEPGTMRSVYSQNVVVTTSAAVALASTMAALQEVFPVTRSLSRPGETRIVRVNDIVIEEIQADFGVMTFDRFSATAGLCVWRHGATGEPLAGEFSWSSRFKESLVSDERAQGHDAAIRLYRRLAQESSDWLLPGTTKTRLVYEYNGRHVDAHE